MALQTVLLFPTRIRATGTLTLAAETGVEYSGTNQKANRRQFVVTNLSDTYTLKLKNRDGIICATVFPRTNFALETTENIVVYNPDAAATVDYEVCEVFLDPGARLAGLEDIGTAYPTSASGITWSNRHDARPSRDGGGLTSVRDV